MQKEYIIIARTNSVSRNGSPYATLKFADESRQAHQICVWDLAPAEPPVVEDIIRIDIEALANIKFPKKYDLGNFDGMHHATPDDLLYDVIPRPISREEWNDTIGRLLNYCTDPQLIDFISAEKDGLYDEYSVQTAATNMHHAFRGGLLNHTHELLSMLDGIYPTLPPLKIERCILGIMFHDYGKAREYDPQTFEPTKYQPLMGHIYISAHVLHNKLNAAKIPAAETNFIVHCVLAHHGVREYGSPVVPCTLEALVVHHLDDLSAKAYSFNELANMERSPMLETRVVKG